MQYCYMYMYVCIASPAVTQLQVQMPDHIGGFPVDFLKQVVSTDHCTYVPLYVRLLRPCFHMAS